ncbi:hypothetical protein ACQ4PT_006931 [Festuca glaucescens]
MLQEKRRKWKKWRKSMRHKKMNGKELYSRFNFFYEWFWGQRARLESDVRYYRDGTGPKLVVQAPISSPIWCLPYRDAYESEQQFMELRNKIYKIKLDTRNKLGLEEEDKELHEVKMAEEHSKSEREGTKLEMDKVMEMAEVETKCEIEEGKLITEAESKLEEGGIEMAGADTKLEIVEAKEMAAESNSEIEEPDEMSEALTVLSADMEDLFAQYRDGWESLWSSKVDRFGSFVDTTSLSPMHFTHCTSGHLPHSAVVANTLQVYSIKVEEINEALELKWPLHVYGVVAARDTVDRNRNLIFLRQRYNCQTLTQKEPFLHLTGPSRAIVAIDPVNFEIELKVRGRTESEDRVLMSQAFHYSGNLCGSDATLSNDLCKIVLDFEELQQTVQATIVGVHVVKGKPFKHGCRVICVAEPPSKPVELQHKVSKPVVLRDRMAATQSDCHISLSRHVVSVQLHGMLKVVIFTYSSTGHKETARGRVFFTARECKTSWGRCDLGHSKVEVTVAWSRLVRDKLSLLSEGEL